MGQKVNGQASQGLGSKPKTALSSGNQQKNRIYNALKNARSDIDPVIKKVDASAIPQDAYDIGDLEKTPDSSDVPVFKGSELLKNCQDKNASAITYQRGKDHYILPTADLEHILQEQKRFTQVLNLPLTSDIAFETVNEFICANNVVDKKEQWHDLSFHVLEHVNMDNFNVIQAHEAEHGLQQYHETDSNHIIKVFTQDPNALIKQRKYEFGANEFATRLFGVDRVIQAELSVAGYLNSLDSTRHDPAFHKELHEKSFGFGNDMHNDHPSMGRMIQYEESIKKLHKNGFNTSQKPALPTADAQWKPAVQTNKK